MSSKVPNVVLKNGMKMPMIGLGTWMGAKGELGSAVQLAIDMGYRHIDCAHLYGNEEEIGDAIAAKIKDGTIKREDIFITSKIWNTCHRPELVRGAMETTLKNLKLDYLDLYLMHWPTGYKEGDDLFPSSPDGKIIPSDVDYLDTWKEMEKLVGAGLAKSIGISNFNSKQIDRLLSVAKVHPVVNQIECHPYLAQKKLRAFCEERNISITGYCPLGSPERPWARTTDPVLLKEDIVKDLAVVYKKTAAQIVLRWQLQLGHVIIPKSTNKIRMAENFNILDFELSKSDMDALSSLDRGFRYVGLSAALGHKYHPFENDEF